MIILCLLLTSFSHLILILLYSFVLLYYLIFVSKFYVIYLSVYFLRHFYNFLLPLFIPTIPALFRATYSNSVYAACVGSFSGPDLAISSLCYSKFPFLRITLLP
jgi:hypothetical protein